MIPAIAGENDVAEIISIILAIGLATGFSTLSEYRNTSRSEALQEEYNKTYAKVIRGGKLVKILTSEIVKGDTVLIQSGDKVPADGLIFEGNVKVSQAALNGESRDESKSAADDGRCGDYRLQLRKQGFHGLCSYKRGRLHGSYRGWRRIRAWKDQQGADR